MSTLPHPNVQLPKDATPAQIVQFSSKVQANFDAIAAALK